MLTIKPPPIWDAKKFAARYHLDTNSDFYIDADGMLVVFPTLTDNPPIFEAPDPPREPIMTRLDKVVNLPDLITILKDVL